MAYIVPRSLEESGRLISIDWYWF